MRHTRRVIGGILILACATLAAQQSQQARSSASGVYTAEQASAGEKIYFDKCATCHGDDLGGRERAPALTGASFVEAWSGKDLRQLLDRLESMPPTAPKSLSATEYASVLAFLLRNAEMPSGSTALPTDRGQLARITFGRSTGVAAPGAAAAAARNAATPQPRRRRAAIAAGGDHRRANDDLADLRRQPGEPSLLTRRPDYEGQLQQAGNRLAAEDRFPRPAAGHAVFGDATGGRPRALYDRRHAAGGDRTGRRHRRNALDARGGRRSSRSERAAQRRRPRPRLLGQRRRRRSARDLRHARLSDAGARREDRHPRTGVREERRRRPEARSGSGGRPRHRRARPQRHAARRRRRDRRRRLAPPRRRAADDAERARHGAWLRCPHRQAALDFSHHSAARRVRLRHLAGELRRLQRQHRRLGADECGPRRWGSSTCPSKWRRAITTAAIGRATRCSPTACSRSTSRRAAASGITRPCITTCGTGICPARRSCSTCR